MIDFLKEDVSSLFVIEKQSRQILAYISLTADTVALKTSEKKKVGLSEIPFYFCQQ